MKPRPLSARLRAMLRAETRGTSARKLAPQLGVSHATISRFLAGFAPSARLVDALAARYWGELSA